MAQQLGTTAYYKTNMNGNEGYEALSYAGNTPSGYTPIDYNSYLSGLQGKLSTAQNFLNTYDTSNPYAILPKAVLAGTQPWDGSYYTGQTYTNADVQKYQDLINQVTSKQGIYADNYIDPAYSKYLPNAPTPSEQYYTPEAKAEADRNMAALTSLQSQGLPLQTVNGQPNSALGPVGQAPTSTTPVTLANGQTMTGFNAATPTQQNFAPSITMDQAAGYNPTYGPQGQVLSLGNIQQGFQNALASGQPPPQTQGAASSAIQSLTPATLSNPGPTGLSPIDQLLAQDPGYQQLLADRAQYNSIANQSKSLLDFYNQYVKDAGIPALNAQLLNYKKVIDGTEDDVRLEVTKTNGFATDSQVLAAANARNKTLIKNYNNLLATKEMAMENINNMVNLASQDRTFALNSAAQKLQIDQQISDYKQKFIQNAQEGYKNVISAIGYDGLFDSLKSDPSSVALAERTLGLQPGQLQGISTQIQQKANLKAIQESGATTPFVSIGKEIQNSATGYAYTTPEDFKNKVGMTIQDAIAKGMVQPLGPSLDTQQKLADIAYKQAETYKVLHPKSSGAGGGSPSGGGPLSAITQSVIANPTLYNGLTPTQKALVLGQLQSNGYDVSGLASNTAIQKSKDALAAFSSATQLLGTIENLTNKVVTARNAGSAFLQNIRGNIQARLKTNKDISVFRDTIKAFSSQLARASGEKGVLTDLDVQRIQNALPKLGDTADIAQAKLATLKGLFEGIAQGAVQANLTSSGQLQTKSMNNDPMGIR